MYCPKKNLSDLLSEPLVGDRVDQYLELAKSIRKIIKAGGGSCLGHFNRRKIEIHDEILKLIGCPLNMKEKYKTCIREDCKKVQLSNLVYELIEEGDLYED